MPNCTVDNMTANELREYVLSRQMGFTKDEIDSPEKLDKVFKLTRQIIKTAEVEVKVLGTTVKAKLHLSEGDKIQRYVDVNTGKLILDSRVTDAVQEKFIKSQRGDMKKVKEVSERKDNVIKANGGTKVHALAQYFMEWIVAEDKSGLVEKNSSEYNKPLNTEESRKLRNELGISKQDADILYDGVKEIFDEIVSRQKKLDKTGKVRIYTEQLIMDVGAKQSIGGTIDLLAVFSNMMAMKFDYKTMTPKKGSMPEGTINDPEWIPYYKYEDFDIQTRELRRILTERYGVKGFYADRIVPIHIEYGYNTEKKEMIDKIDKIRMGTKNRTGSEYLEQIPMGELNTGIKKLDEQIEILTISLHNDLKRLNDRYDSGLAAKISRRRMVLAKLALKQDVNYMLADVRKIVEKFYDKAGKPVNIHDQYIDEELNPHYLTTREINDLYEEMYAYQGILKTSDQLFVELEFTDEVEKDKYDLNRYRILGAINELLPVLAQERIDRILSEDDILAIRDVTSLGIVDKWVRKMGEINHPIFIKFKELISTAHDKTRIDEQTLEKQVKTHVKELEDWGARNGISGTDVFKKLINDKGHLHDKYSKEFYDDLRKAQEEKDNKWLSNNLILKENSKEIYQEELDKFLLNSGIKEDTTEKSEVRRLKAWKERNNIKDAKYKSKMFRKYYTINEELNSKYFSEGYNYIKQGGNEPLLNFWNFYTQKMGEFRFLLGLTNDYDRLPNNFIPWVRADIVNSLLQGGYNFQSIKDNMESIFRVKGDTQVFGSTIKGEINPITGAEKRDVPVWYLNPLTDTNGEINQGLKSVDLGKSLFIFGSMAMNYNYMKNEVEPNVEALRDVLVSVGIKDVNSTGGERKASTGPISKLKGERIDHVSLFDTFVNYHLYGVKIQDKNTKAVKAVLGAARFQQMKELSFAVLTWIGNFAQVKVGSWTEGIKGYYYNREQWIEAAKEAGSDEYRALTYIFEISSDRKFVKSKNLSVNKLSKILSTDTLMFGFRKASENVSNHILMSMLRNYGLDEQGNIKRLANLPQGTKSLRDGVRIVNDNVVIDGLINEDGSITGRFTEFRNMVVAIAGRVTGDMNPEDINYANTQLITNLAMRFKNWMPGMLGERFGGMRYNPLTKTIEEGRYWSLITNLNKEEASWGKYIVTEVMPAIAKISFHIATFGGYKYKVNEHRAKILFENYKMQNPNSKDIQSMSFGDFMAYKQGQIKAAATELRVILSLVTILMALRGDWDDDEEPDYKQTLAGRLLFRSLNRMRMEIAFFLNTDDWYRLFRFPIPLVGLADDVFATVKNTRDELGDWIYGEETERTYAKRLLFGANKEGKRDKKPLLYESSQWIPGYKAIRILEPFEQHRELEY